jgi:hypothetical protein
LGVLLVVSLVPVTWLEGVPLLVERVLGAVVGDAPSGSYSFDHLACFSILYGLGFVFIVVFRKWERDDGI